MAKLVPALACLVPLSANAFNLDEKTVGALFDLTPDHVPIKWEDNACELRVHTVSFPSGSAEFDEVTESAELWDLNHLAGADLGVLVATTALNTVSNSDGENSIQFITMQDLDTDLLGDHDLQPCVTPGLTEPRWNTVGVQWGSDPKYKEVDIWLDVDCNWQVGHDWYDIQTADYEADIRSLGQVVVHEVGHFVGLDHEDGLETVVDEITTDYTGFPATMAHSFHGGGVFDVGYLQREYVVNEDDREGVRALYGALQQNDVDFSVQSYTVQDDEILTALLGTDCGNWIGTGLARPNPSVDIFAAAEDLGYAYGDCPDGPTGWATPPVAVPQPLELVNAAPFNVRFTYASLGEVGGDVNWKLYFTDDPSGVNCPGAACWRCSTGQRRSTPTSRTSMLLCW